MTDIITHTELIMLIIVALRPGISKVPKMLINCWLGLGVEPYYLSLTRATLSLAISKYYIRGAHAYEIKSVISSFPSIALSLLHAPLLRNRNSADEIYRNSSRWRAGKEHGRHSFRK